MLLAEQPQEIGGSVSVSNGGTGGVNISASAGLTVSATVGSGGNISISASQGLLTVNGSSLSANGSGSGSGFYNGGTITLTSKGACFCRRRT